MFLIDLHLFIILIILHVWSQEHITDKNHRLNVNIEGKKIKNVKKTEVSGFIHRQKLSLDRLY